MQLARLVSVRPRASFRRGARVGQGAQRAFPEPVDHRSALVPAEDPLDDVSLMSLDETDDLTNRQDFSHRPADVKSLLDEVLRRGSVSVKPEGERRVVGYAAYVLVW